jgi:hypothetical protein
MKIAGLEQSLLRVRDFQLRTDPPLIVRLTALPLAFMERLRMKMPAPVQPQQTITQMGGKTTLVPDESDSPAAMRWRKEDHEDDIAVTAAIVHEALRGDQSITWESDPTKFKTHRDYLLALHKELEDAGFSSGEVSRIAKAVGEMSSLDDEGLAKAKGFLPETGKAH